MGIKLFNCDCEYKEVGNKVEGSSAKGYVLVSECDDCKAKREVDAIKAEERRIEEEKERKILAEKDRILREEAEQNLRDRGEI